MQSQQQLNARSPAHLGAGAGSHNAQHSVPLLQQKSHKFRQDTSSSRCYFQKPTTTALKHLLQPSVQTRAAGAQWLAAKRISSLQDKTEAVHLSFLSSSS